MALLAQLPLLPFSISFLPFSTDPLLLTICTTPLLSDDNDNSAFIQSSYPAVKQANPDLPILIREALGTPARAFARFGESRAGVNGLFIVAIVVKSGQEGRLAWPRRGRMEGPAL